MAITKKGVCPVCFLEVPQQRFVAVQAATKEIYICRHHEADWAAKVKIEAEKICNLAGEICNSITDLGGKISGEISLEKIVSLAEKLLEAIYKKAQHFRTMAGKELAIFREHLFRLSHYLGYERQAMEFI